MNRTTRRRGSHRRYSSLSLLAVFAMTLALVVAPGAAGADPHPNQSTNVVIIGGTNVWHGGNLPTTGPVGDPLLDFTFTSIGAGSVDAATLAAYDTAVLNVGSGGTLGMFCNVNALSAQAKADLVAFVDAGHKLIITDSECTPQDYSWLPYPFTTSNPGAAGASGTLAIVEDNFLSDNDSTDLHYIDAAFLGSSTDAVGDMNVMTTFDPNWCVDMSGTNILNVTGPVHTYAKTGVDVGLIVYNGLDLDYLGYTGGGGIGNMWLEKMWVQELQQPFNPSDLPCGVTVVGITLGPETDQNIVGEDHTVTAVLTDLLGSPMPGIDVTFNVLSGPNAGDTGTDTTDASGVASFTYQGDNGIGFDNIEACFTNDSTLVCSQIVEKEWLPLPEIPVPVDVKPTSCRNPFNFGQKGVTPVAILGTSDFDVQMVYPATVTLEGVTPLRWSEKDVATPYVPYLGKTDAFDCTDEGPDGYLDLTFKFDSRGLAAALGPVADGDVVLLHLEGELFDGTKIVGEDVIAILRK